MQWPPNSIAVFFALLICWTWISPAPLPALQPNPAPQTAPSHQPEPIDRLLTGLVLKHMPHSYTKDKDWGKQKEQVVGLGLRREGLKVETFRKRKLVNHGTWRKYSAELADPVNQLSVSLENMHKVGENKIAFEINFIAKLNLFARQAKWSHGIQLYSISAEGATLVHLRITLEMEIRADLKRFPPDLLFIPVAKDADLMVHDFQIDRVSKLGGEFSQQVTKAARKKMDEAIIEKKTELVTKLNREFEKNEQDFRLSIADALNSKWATQTIPFFSPGLREVIETPPNDAAPNGAPLNQAPTNQAPIDKAPIDKVPSR